MWIVATFERFYPSVKTFDNYKDAKECYDNLEVDDYQPMSIYIAEVKEYKQSNYKFI
jgi:hypothetical protein